MNERIAMIRKQAGLSQDDFGKALNISRNYVWMIEKGDRVPSDRTIVDICREFNVNETWLRTGEGEMHKNLSRDEALAAAFGKMLSEDDSDETVRIKKAMIGELLAMPPEAWEHVLTFLKNIFGE